MGSYGSGLYGAGTYGTVAAATIVGVNGAPNLTPVTPKVGGPGVSVVFTNVASNVAGMNVWRAAEGRLYPVRGGVRARISGAGGFFDPEPPFGVRSTYYAELLDSAGNSLGYTGSTTIQIDSTVSWIHNPLNPAGAIPVRVAASTGGTVAGQVDTNVYYPVGRVAGVAITGQRRGIPSVPLTVWADTDAQSAALDAMFGRTNGDLSLPPFLCVRLASRFTIPLPRPLFLAVPAPTRTPAASLAGRPLTGWTLNGAEVDPPTPALAQALLTRADLDAYYPTRAARDRAYLTRLAADTDYNIAGYAGGTTSSSSLPPTPGAGLGGVTTDNGDGGGTYSATLVDNGDGGGTLT